MKNNKRAAPALTSVIKDKVCPRSKRSQTTLFIIIGVIIVALAILIYSFYPEIKSSLGFEDESPSDFISTCLIDNLQESVDDLSLHGGSINPEHYIVYNGNSIEYLCYTNEFYRTCVVQQPMLKNYIETEIESNVRLQASRCFDKLKEKYEKKGYDVTLRKGDIKVELLPKRIVASFNSSLILNKEGSDTYERFSVVLHNNLYELISIANSIIEWETLYGDAETTTYMAYYKDLKVEKKVQTDGSTIYILTDRNNENKFQFASRSVVWPPGYGF